MEVDPLASMRCWGLELELGGRTCDVPPLSAVHWWPVLTSGDLTRVLDLVVSTPGEGFDLDQLLLDSILGEGELRQVLSDAMEEVAGRSFHVAYVIAMVAGMHWASINGAMVRRGFRWEGQPLGAALDAIYAEIIERLDEESTARFTELLENEELSKPGRPGKKRKVSDKAISEFEAMAGPRPTGAAATAALSDSEHPRTPRPPRPPRPRAPSTAPRRRRARPAGSDPPASL